MRKYYSIPLIFLLLAAALGLYLRWQFIAPMPGVRYAWFLHSHSHAMFLGWVFNLFYLSFLNHYLPERVHGRYMNFFWLLQVLVAAMMISFPLQGYGLYSIIFSTLHTVLIMIFIAIFFRHTRNQTCTSLWFARVAWIFFLLSTAGPFSLGLLMANGLGQSVWYNFSIYYYLHFQYNGFFTFGIFSLFYLLLERKEILFGREEARKIGILMAAASVPAFALSILYAQPGLWFNIMGAGAALLQLFALYLFLRQLRGLYHEIKAQFDPFVLKIMALILNLVFIKSFLQLVSAYDLAAQLAYERRPVVIAYLHLVLVGVITLFLLSWYLEMDLVKKSAAKLAMQVVLVGFTGMELCLLLQPWWSQVVGHDISAATSIFVFSALLFIGFFIFHMSFLIKGKATGSL